MTDTNALADLSQRLADVVAHAGRSIVRVEARRRGHASGIAWSSDGHVVTAHHAVERDHDLRIGLPDGEIVEAELIGRDPGTDLALLHAAGAGLTPPAWAEATSLQVGHLVLSVGRHDEPAQASLGIVSKKDGAWHTSGGSRIDAYVQTDIAVYPGFSGSALVDAHAQVCGMNTSWFRRRSSLAIPTATVRRVVHHLAEHGHVRRGWLGIAAQPVRLPAAVRDELGQATGLLILSVEPDSPAEQGGLYVGDQLVALGGEPVQKVSHLMTLLAGERVGQPVEIGIVRGGRTETLTLTIGERR